MTNSYSIPLCVVTSTQYPDPVFDSYIRTPYHYIVEPLEDKKSIGIEVVRELNKYLSSSSLPRHCVIFAQFQIVTEEAQNGLLKLLEEHSVHHDFLLVTPTLATVLATIQSRCRIEKLNGENTTTGLTQCEKLWETISETGEKEIGKAFVSVTKDKGIQLMKDMVGYLHTLMMHMPDAQVAEAVRELQSALCLVERNQVGAQTALDNWIIFVIQHRHGSKTKRLHIA